MSEQATSAAQREPEKAAETVPVITLAGVSPATDRPGEPTAQEIMWAHYLKEQQHGRTPPGPADTTHPRRALARLALSAAYCEAADFAAGGVPTVSDQYGDPWDYVDHAARLVAIAQDVLARAVVYARERGGTWDTIAEALDTTPKQARDQYTATVDRWEDALDRPWQRSGPFLASRMPDGTTEPDETIADLDQWCLRHLEEHSGARHNARQDGIEDRMVSANLPKHTPLTEIAGLTRTAASLVRRGAEATEAERDAYETRKKALITKLRQPMT